MESLLGCSLPRNYTKTSPIASSPSETVTLPYKLFNDRAGCHSQSAGICRGGSGRTYDSESTTGYGGGVVTMNDHTSMWPDTPSRNVLEQVGNSLLDMGSERALRRTGELYLRDSEKLIERLLDAYYIVVCTGWHWTKVPAFEGLREMCGTQLSTRTCSCSIISAGRRKEYISVLEVSQFADVAPG